MIVGLVGLLTFIRSPIIDIVAGLCASDHAWAPFAEGGE